MSRTRKDHPKFRRAHWQSIYQPSWWNRSLNRRMRSKAAADLRNGREPLPRYKDTKNWYW